MSVFANSATLSVPLIRIAVDVVDAVVGVLVGCVLGVVRDDIEVKNLMVASGLTVFFNAENVLESIQIHHSAQVR